jgi:lipoprotein-anchoring transpeptidase ErfK/SrfK
MRYAVAVTFGRRLLLAATLAALFAAPAFADGTTPPPTTTTATTTAQPSTPAPKASAAVKTKRTTFHVNTVFPAAGQLLVNSVAARVSPNPHAGVVKVMHMFRPDYRTQEILALSTRIGSDGKPWYKISVPMRPNGMKGWIPARSVSLAPTVSQILINRSARTIDIYWHGKHALHAIVAIGAPGMETPVGHYYVAARFVPYQDPFLGVFAVETSAYSKLTEWPGGGVVGIHGTSEPQLLGQAVSHGCVRVANTTAAAMRKLAPLGTPITITG